MTESSGIRKVVGRSDVLYGLGNKVKIKLSDSVWEHTGEDLFTLYA